MSPQAWASILFLSFHRVYLEKVISTQHASACHIRTRIYYSSGPWTRLLLTLLWLKSKLWRPCQLCAFSPYSCDRSYLSFHRIFLLNLYINGVKNNPISVFPFGKTSLTTLFAEAWQSSPHATQLYCTQPKPVTKFRPKSQENPWSGAKNVDWMLIVTFQLQLRTSTVGQW